MNTSEMGFWVGVIDPVLVSVSAASSAAADLPAA